MFKLFSQLSSDFNFNKKYLLSLISLQLGAIVFEGIGIGMFLPVFQYMKSDGDVDALVATSELWGKLVDLFLIFNVQLNLASLLSVAFICFLFRQLFIYFRLIHTNNIQFDLIMNTRDDCFNHYLHATLSYHDKIKGGNIINELTNELRLAVDCIIGIINFFGYSILCLVYLAGLFSISITMTVSTAMVLGVTIYFLKRILNETKVVGEKLTIANQDMTTFLVERLKSVRLVRISGMEYAEAEEMKGLNKNQRKQVISILSLKALMGVLVEPIIIAVSFVMLYLSVTVFKLSIELVLIYFLILIRITPVMKELMVRRQSILGSMASVNILKERIIQLQNSAENHTGTVKFMGLNNDIKIESIYFKYSSKSDDWIIDDLSLTIPSSKMTAIVGASGSGKSTLIDLLLGLRKISEGKILFNEINLDDLDVSSLRAGVAFVPQSPQIFNVSVAEHIRYGLPGATMEDIIYAASMACADSFIRKLPDGYNTIMGEQAILLSGGERQRIDLARALIRRASILILDEPTSNFDAEAESEFKKSLNKIRRETNTTIIVIGHRLSSVIDANQIVVMKDGKVIETGNHDELLVYGGWYAKAYEKQTNRKSNIV